MAVSTPRAVYDARTPAAPIRLEVNGATLRMSTDNAHALLKELSAVLLEAALKAPQSP